MGGRETRNTAAAALESGLRFGFVGSSDDHAGFPGAYGEGLMAALVRDFTREGILEAIRARRTYALTGDRIEVDFTVDGAPMGSTVQAARSAEAIFSVQGRDELDVVEVIQDGRIVHRAFGDARQSEDEPVQVRLEWGWGPWGALALDRICDWSMTVRIENGRLDRFFPCLQSMPFDEKRRHRFERQGEGTLAIRSYTARHNAYRENPNQSVILEIEGGAQTVLELSLTEPAEQTSRHRLGELQKNSANLFTGPFPKEAYQWHRVVPRSASSLQGRCRLDVPGGRSHAYLRVRQRNGHVAWASPVFLNW